MQDSTDPQSIQLPKISLKELAEILIKHYGLHDGVYGLSIDFQVAVGAIGPNKEEVLPGVMLGVSNIGLIASPIDGPHSVDAAAINPKKRASAKKAPAKAK